MKKQMLVVDTHAKWAAQTCQRVLRRVSLPVISPCLLHTSTRAHDACVK